jgi:hypothetical protein
MKSLEKDRKRSVSRGTIGMLDSSYGSAYDLPIDDGVLNNSNLTAVIE